MRAPTDREWHLAQSDWDYALRWPVIWVSSEMMCYVEHRWAWYYSNAHHDWDWDCYLFALLPLIPFVKLWFFWQRSRWIIERTLRHRIFIVKEGHHCSEWTLAPFRKWSWKRNWRRMVAP